MKNILCVHSSCELYGSDRSFATSVEAIREMCPEARIEVLFPCRGPLCGIGPFRSLPFSIRNLWILRRKGLFRGFMHVFKNINLLRQALESMNKHDFVYINTIVIFDYIFAARFAKGPVVIHVREIPSGLERAIFRRLLIWSRASLVFNSIATQKVFDLPKHVHSCVVYNGVKESSAVVSSDYDGKRDLRILVIGRINRWKGQGVVVSAVELLPKELQLKVRVRIIGDVFGGQTEFKDKLIEQIDRANLKGIVRVDPFEENPEASYLWCDVVVVPSLLPEPFGRVAIEAMAYARPVIASAHGGLLEIVEDNVTGVLFAPNGAAELSGAIRHMIEKPNMVRSMGEAGRMRFSRKFTDVAVRRELANAFAQAEVKANAVK